MPNTQNRGNKDLSRFDNMKDEELEELLRLDAQKTEGEESDLETILYVMEVLAARKRNSDNSGKTAQEAFKSFKENYMPHTDSETEENSVHRSARQPRRWLRSLSAVAAALAIVVMCSVTANAWGFDIWGTVAKWTQETFSFGNGSELHLTEPTVEDPGEMSALQQELVKQKIQTPLVPAWFPEGYELADVRVDETPVQLTIIAIYRNGEQEIKIQIRRYLDADPQLVEKSGSLVEVYEADGITYYIFSNTDEICAAWINESYECYILGELTVEEAKRMIDSI